MESSRRPWISVKVAAAALDLSEDTIIHFIDRGELQAANVSAGSLRRRLRVDLASLRALATRRGIELPERYYA